MTAQEFWEVIANHLTKQELNRLEELPPGVSEEQLKAAGRQMGVRLPRAFENFYRTHDGMARWEFRCTEENADSQLVGVRIGSLADVVETWKAQCELGRRHSLDWGTPAEKRESPWEEPTAWTVQGSSVGFSARTVGVRCEHWHPGWIPFADSGSGDYVFLDLAADDGGRNGQIVEWWHENSMTRLAAYSFIDWLETIAEGIRDGSMKVIAGLAQ